MTKFSLTQAFLVAQALLLTLVGAAPQTRKYAQLHPRAISNTTNAGNITAAGTSNYWLATIDRQGTVPTAFGGSEGYKIFRNVVKDYGATGDGSTDDTDAINKAISDGNRCGQGCDSSTITPALVYFPPGTYVVSKPIIQYYYTQLVGDATAPPTIKAASDFQGIAVIDSDPYVDGGANWYTNQNNFFRQVRNFVIDLTSMPATSGAGIHWQVAQATSLQNIRFEMVKGGTGNAQQGIFMDNGSGGFFSDLVFNGGNYGAFLGNQQFTTRNLTFNDCNTAIFMNWNWVWTLKSVTINNCQTGIDMSNSPQNQTVGSVLVLDSKFSNTPTGIRTAFSTDSVPETGGTLIIDNVDFSGSQNAVVGTDNNSILTGGSVVASWGQGNAYIPGSSGSKIKRAEAAEPDSDDCDDENENATITRRSEVASPTATGQSEGFSVPAGTATSFPVMSNATAGAGIAFPTGSVGNSTGATCSAAAPSVSKSRIQQQLTAPTKAAALTNNGAVFERAKPQYEDVPESSFVSVKSAGAKGDGATDDTEAIQNVLNSATPDQVVYFDHGYYVVTQTVKVPKTIRMTGEIWSVIMASGDFFGDQSNPKPVFQIGQAGDTGSVEISDLIFETKGPVEGAIMMEWNVAEESQGSAAMWDTHFRIGGSAGTGLQSDHCSKNENVTTSFDPKCAGAFLLLHITESASAYLENTWFWVADHELDMDDHNQINIFNGRGVLSQSKGPVWMYGTASEHSQLYNYQLDGAQDNYIALAQTETFYGQSNPDALGGGFTPNAQFNDPDFADCTTESCKKTWGLRVVDSSDILMFGGGLYSFFDNYKQSCLDTESCQENMVDIQCSDNVHIYGLSTKASVSMVSQNGQSQVKGLDNDDNFCQTIAVFESS
ncbi:MAG: hypothetical protein Q9227_000626 [Pyrenula ochraceoflavens]